jgi:hypothetical protein
VLTSRVIIYCTTIWILCSKYNASCYYHFADDGKEVDGLPSEGVEITYFDLVILLPLIRHLHKYVYEFSSPFEWFVLIQEFHEVFSS